MILSSTEGVKRKFRRADWRKLRKELVNWKTELGSRAQSSMDREMPNPRRGCATEQEAEPSASSNHTVSDGEMNGQKLI